MHPVFHFKSNISSYTLDHGTFKSAFFFKENDLPNLHEEMFQPLIFRVCIFCLKNVLLQKMAI